MESYIFSSELSNFFSLSFIALTTGYAFYREIIPNIEYLKAVGIQLEGNKITFSNHTRGKGHLILHQKEELLN